MYTMSMTRYVKRREPYDSLVETVGSKAKSTVSSSGIILFILASSSSTFCPKNTTQIWSTTDLKVSPR